MAVWIRDGFEFYTNLGDAILGSGYGLWQAVSGSSAFSTFTRFGLGQSLNLVATNHATMTATGFSNQSTIFFGLSAALNAALGGASFSIEIIIRDAGSVQCTIQFSNDGKIVLRDSVNGTALATYSSAFLGSQWNQYQFKVVINNTTGEFHVRKNGNTSDDFSATGLNTRNGSANNYANEFLIGAGSQSSSWCIDDFAAWDSSGGAPWNNFVGDFRILQLMPNSDNSVQFSQTNGGSTQAGDSTQSGGNTLSIAANTIQTTRVVVPTSGGTFTTMNAIYNAAPGGNAKLAVYDSDGSTGSLPTSNNQPGTLLATSNAVANPTGTQAFTFGSPVTLQNGHTYFFALLADTATVLKAGGNTTCWSVARTYGSGFTNPAGVSSAGQNVPLIYVPTLTTLNSGLVNDYTQDGATTYVFDSTVGHSDLYGISGLPVTPSSVLGLDLVGMLSKSDAGTRGVKLQMTSSGTNQLYTEVFPNTTFNYYRYQQDTDPHTSAAWTPTAVNNLLIGQKITT